MARVPENTEVQTNSTVGDDKYTRSENDQSGLIRHRRVFDPSAGIVQAGLRPTERSLGDLPPQAIPGLTIAQVIHIRKLINARRLDEESWLRRHAFPILLIALISVFAGVAWKRIETLETNLRSKAVDIIFDAVLTIAENNPELLGEERVTGMLRLAERHIQQTFEDFSGRLETLISAEGVTSENLLKSAHENFHKGQHLRSMALYKLSWRQFKKENPSPDDAADRIGLTVAQLSGTVHPLVQAGSSSHEMAVIHGVRYMEGLLDELLSLEGVTPSVKALTIGRCSIDLVRSMVEIGELDKAVQLAEAGITVLEDEFLDEVSRYQYYGYLINNQGTAYEAKKDFSKATACYARALEAKIKAVDYGNEENKKADLDMTRNNVARAQANI